MSIFCFCLCRCCLWLMRERRYSNTDSLHSVLVVPFLWLNKWPDWAALEIGPHAAGDGCLIESPQSGHSAYTSDVMLNIISLLSVHNLLLCSQRKLEEQAHSKEWVNAFLTTGQAYILHLFARIFQEIRSPLTWLQSSSREEKSEQKKRRETIGIIIYITCLIKMYYMLI